MSKNKDCVNFNARSGEKLKVRFSCNGTVQNSGLISAFI